MTRVLLITLVALAMSTPTAIVAQRRTTPRTSQQVCSVVSPATPLRELPEASGIARSRRAANILWLHNDSPEPVLYAVDATGSIRSRVRVTGATVVDWEDIAAGSCSQGDCLYVADIGDNYGQRKTISIYRVAEPRLDATATAPAERLDLTYPDGPHDAEALFITSSGQLFIVTKTRATMTALYRVPQTARPGSVARLERVKRLPLANVTGGSADGDWVALRTNRELFFYRTRELLSGNDPVPVAIDLRMLREPQGEGVALAGDGTVYLVGERGTGTFAALRCSLP